MLLGRKRERAIRIWLSREGMEAFGLTVSEIRQALSRENVEAGGGTIEGGALEFAVWTQGEIKEVSGFGKIVVASREGRWVRLSDVARVEDGLEDLRGIAAVFLPVTFMRGASGRFFYEFGVTVKIPVLVSLFVSFTLTPMLCSRFLVVSEYTWPRLRSGYLALENWYTRRLAAALRHRGLVLSTALLLFVLSLLLARSIGSEFTPSEDVARAVVRFETPIGSSLEYTDAKVAALEKVLAGLR